MQQTYGIHWFRRDLRVAGNLALQENWKQNDGRVVGVFCFDKVFLSRSDFSVNRFQFFINTLAELKKELRELGSDLLFMDIGPQQAFPKLLKQLEKERSGLPKVISWGVDYEPFAVKRDQEMQKVFPSLGVSCLSMRDHLLIEPHELAKKNDPEGHYQVYSPFARQWLEIFRGEEVQRRVKAQNAGLKYLQKRAKGQTEKIFKLNWKNLLTNLEEYDSNLKKYQEENGKKTTVEIPATGSLVAYEAMQDFKKRIDTYKEKRDFPSINGTSKFSLFLKNGSLTVPQIIAFFELEPYKKKKTNRDSFFSELIWREFYYHILKHNPRVETEAFLPQYQGLQWQNDKKFFQAWKDGKTGFPIVDAGMRQLKTTGWMHNRVRMIVASFLTKDLLIDWQWGEKYFMEQLLDGDLAPNNGGWQWAASTGCDPQPYFRIFNPWLQSKKFDPDGVYIKTFVPELKDLDPKDLHQEIYNHPTYPKPIVDHSEQRDKALELYKWQKDSFQG